MIDVRTERKEGVNILILICDFILFVKKIEIYISDCLYGDTLFACKM